jgi:hypothetical protein
VHADRTTSSYATSAGTWLPLSNRLMKNCEPSRTSIASSLSWYGSYSTRTHGLPTSESNSVTAQHQPNGNKNKKTKKQKTGANGRGWSQQNKKQNKNKTNTIGFYVEPNKSPNGVSF